MKTIDIHTHLLSSSVRFDRFYDRLALRIFARKFGLDPRALALDPYGEYTRALVASLRGSQHVEKAVVFGVDARTDEAGRELHRDITVCATNDDVEALYRSAPDVIIPFFSINPNRPDALELIDRYADAGFRGAKFLQNYWGVDTREKRYRPYFDKLAERNLPLIVHIGSENSVHSFKSCEGIEMLDHPLEAGVRVISAHMALSYEPRRIFRAFSKKPDHFNDEYFTLLGMLKRHPNLYADISALLTPVRAKVLRHLSEQDEVHHKLLFGTDFPVPFTTVLNSYDLPYRKRFELSREANPFDRYAKAILEYFPADHPIYTNHTKILEG